MENIEKLCPECNLCYHVEEHDVFAKDPNSYYIRIRDSFAMHKKCCTGQAVAASYSRKYPTTLAVHS